MTRPQATGWRGASSVWLSNHKHGVIFWMGGMVLLRESGPIVVASDGLQAVRFRA
jgi:hypothetical protein